MPKTRHATYLWFLLMAVALLMGCNMPGRRTPTPSGFEMINTAAARTVAAQLTEISKPPVSPAGPTFFPGQLTPTLSSTVVAGRTPTAVNQSTQAFALTQVPQPTQAPTAGACDRARFVKDVTVPDNTVFQPGENFTKTWRLRNVGECTWGEGYALVFVGGEPLTVTTRVPLPTIAKSDQTIDISVEMVAPPNGGTFRSNWKLSNSAGQVFGTGADSDQPIWAQIKVNTDQQSGSSTGTQFDFVSNASIATWFTGVSDSSGSPIAFGGSVDNSEGSAMVADQLRLETGQTSGKILLTIPRMQKDGYVYGIFPQYRVEAGDHFIARVGFAANPDGQCGVGKAIFQVAAKQGDDIDTLYEISATCDRSLTLIDVDLSNLRSQIVEFILAVRADGSSQDDWAVWNSPQIKR